MYTRFPVLCLWLWSGPIRERERDIWTLGCSEQLSDGALCWAPATDSLRHSVRMRQYTSMHFKRKDTGIPQKMNGHDKLFEKRHSCHQILKRCQKRYAMLYLHMKMGGSTSLFRKYSERPVFKCASNYKTVIGRPRIKGWPHWIIFKLAIMMRLVIYLIHDSVFK